MSQQSYLDEFVKTAEAFGIDPRELAKYVSEGIDGDVQKTASEFDPVDARIGDGIRAAVARSR